MELQSTLEVNMACNFEQSVVYRVKGCINFSLCAKIQRKVNSKRNKINPEHLIDFKMKL